MDYYIYIKNYLLLFFSIIFLQVANAQNRKGQYSFDNSNIFTTFKFNEDYRRNHSYAFTYGRFISNNSFPTISVSYNASSSTGYHFKRLEIAGSFKQYFSIEKNQKWNLLSSIRVETSFLDYDVRTPLFEQNKLESEFTFGLAYFITNTSSLELSNHLNFFVRRGGFSFFEKINQPDIRLSLLFYFNPKGSFANKEQLLFTDNFNKGNLVLSGLYGRYNKREIGYSSAFFINSRFFLKNNLFLNVNLAKTISKRNEDALHQNSFLLGAGHYFFNNGWFTVFGSVDAKLSHNNNFDLLTPQYHRNDFQIQGKMGCTFYKNKQGLSFIYSTRFIKPTVRFEERNNSNPFLHYSYISAEHELRLNKNISSIILLDYYFNQVYHSLQFNQPDGFTFKEVENKQILEFSFGLRYYFKKQ